MFKWLCTLGCLFFGLFYKKIPLFKNFEFFVWDVFDGAYYLLLGFCSWMSIGCTVHFHLNFTRPCSFVTLKYFGMGEYVPVYFILIYFIFERLDLPSLNLGKPSLGLGRPIATMFKVSLVGFTPTTIYKFISHVKHGSWLWERI